MKRHQRVWAVIAALLVAVPSPLSLGQEKKEKEKASIWMQKKLEYSQNILAGLTAGDFNKIGDNAKAMGFMGFLERYERANLPGYKTQLSSFETINKELIRQAGNKNIEGVTLAYTQMTVNCVQCHQIIRDAKR